jgi:hypothetical protein
MSRERAPTFADRLPPLVPKEEPDISHLSDEMVEVLYPGRRARPFRLGLTFEAFAGEGGALAVAVAQRSPAYREERPEDGPARHHAAFATEEARSLRELFQLVGDRPGTEVLVDGKRVPYARELWLPLFWIFVGAEP